MQLLGHVIFKEIVTSAWQAAFDERRNSLFFPRRALTCFENKVCYKVYDKVPHKAYYKVIYTKVYLRK